MGRRMYENIEDREMAEVEYLPEDLNCEEVSI